ncbi:prion-inhibition and propagation-domain-containing protein [Bombardia bombarda]|uniref:Prion-inhibition and propagation-domain-containing protein n=1 Tax=Bombardia bombarda TaxID=252184 RepID=A0AA39X9E2_9PEZI|nr:prion-inhibition and propagation-domain-containing protein [Bombardia bombarda]
MEVLGVSAGFVSLAVDVFDSTMKLFKFVGALVDMPQDCEKYRLQLLIEYNRVLAWGKAAGLIDVPENSTLGVILGTNPTELIAIIARIQRLLSEFKDINSRYGNELDISSDVAVGEAATPDADVVKQVSSLAVSYEAWTTRRRNERRSLSGSRIRSFLDRVAHNTKEVATHPIRVRWVAVDKDAFRALLKNLHKLTERLHELMRDYRERKIDDITAKTYREMVMARNDVQDLKYMMDAVGRQLANYSSITAGTKKRGAQKNDLILQDLIRLKKISHTWEMIFPRLEHIIADNASGSSSSSSSSNSAIDRLMDILLEIGIAVPHYSAAKISEVFEWNERVSTAVPETMSRPRGTVLVSDNYVPVWVEWKTLGDVSNCSSKELESMGRTIALAEMLHMPKPASLHVPDCIGFFDDRQVSGADRYGWIFEMPKGCHFYTRVVSLYSMLGQEWFRPSLTQRVELAVMLCETVMNLHAANWLHKGIISENVIFFVSEGDEARTDDNDRDEGYFSGESRLQPLLSGFEYSRPEGSETTARDADSVWDVYRWPSLQRQHPTERDSRKTYDLYSLGLLLLEIAHWQPLHRIMHLGEEDGDSQKKPPAVPLEQSKLVRDWLLGIRPSVGNDSDVNKAPFERAGKPNPVRELRNIVGYKYSEVVVRCLWAHGQRGFGVDEMSDQSRDSDVGVRLQEAFTEYVVDKLRSVAV